MFWKKKAAELDLELLQAEAADDRRDAFRIATPPEEPVVLSVQGHDYCATNISVGGIAVRGAPLEEGTLHSVRVRLPGVTTTIHTRIEVVSVTARGVCRCRFLQLSRMSRNAIQVYILHREKEQIRTRAHGPRGGRDD